MDNKYALAAVTPRLRRVAFGCILLLVLSFGLSGCSTFQGMFSSFSFGEEEEVKEAPASTLIVEGMDAYDVGDYSKAIKAFSTLLAQYPFSPEAMLAELKSADAHYYDKQYSEAKTLYKSFADRYPSNEAMPYVMFQMAMCDFSRSDRIDRDTASMDEAVKSFNQLLNAYPVSPYAKEAKQKLNDAREYLANHEYAVAVFYVRTEKPQAAKQRLQYLLETYPESALVPQAKELLAHLEAGKTPDWGIKQWLPAFMSSQE